MNKSYFADEDDFGFFGNGTLSKLLIDFDCITEGKWSGQNTKLSDGCAEGLRNLISSGYSIFLNRVPEKEEILEWLDKTFDYPFTCNDEPTRYADTGDHWTTISRELTTSLCHEGETARDRDIQFKGSWKEICSIIEENDILAKTKSASVIYEDKDKYQTTDFLKTIAVPRTDDYVDYGIKPYYEQWSAEIKIWDINKEISENYDVRFEIEQGRLRNHGKWIKIKAKSVDYNWTELLNIINKFCKDFNLSCRKELSFVFPYDLPLKNEDDD